MILRTTLPALLLALVVGCKAEPLPAPDPKGKDLVAGAVVAAATSAEATPGIRTYKVLHVDDYPDPIGFNLHLAAYDPKAPTFEEARDTRRHSNMKAVNAHFEVRLVDFLARDHRVIALEPLSEAELAPYVKARDRR
jgi:hypothetical protein